MISDFNVVLWWQTTGFWSLLGQFWWLFAALLGMWKVSSRLGGSAIFKVWAVQNIVFFLCISPDPVRAWFSVDFAPFCAPFGTLRSGFFYSWGPWGHLFEPSASNVASKGSKMLQNDPKRIQKEPKMCQIYWNVTKMWPQNAPDCYQNLQKSLSKDFKSSWYNRLNSPVGGPSSKV